MTWGYDRMAAATADFIVMEPSHERSLARSAVRTAALAVLLVVFAYCAQIAWGVLQDLGRVSLADLTHALRVVSVRDFILCIVGYRIGRELVVAVVQRRRAG